MAVAVKNAPVSAAPSPFDRMAVVSLVGAAYVIVSLAIVFGVLPYLWRAATGLTGIGGDVLLGLLMVAAATGLAILGARLIGPKQPVGARAGICVAIVLFLVVLLLTRWASLWLEYGVFAHHLFGPSGVTVGLTLTGLILLALLVGEVYLFFRPETEKYLVQLEGQGWFTAASYKGLQGQRVRRGTILGILLLAGSGVYTMMNNGFLRRLPDSWSLNVPFTGVVTVESPGDAGPLLKELPPPETGQVRIVAKGGLVLRGRRRCYPAGLPRRHQGDHRPVAGPERGDEGPAQAGTGQKGCHPDPGPSGGVRRADGGGRPPARRWRQLPPAEACRRPSCGWTSTRSVM